MKKKAPEQVGRKKGLAIGIGVLVSVLIVGALAATMDWAAFFREFSRLEYRYLPLVVFLVYLSFWIRALRWRHLLPSELELSRDKLFRATLVGFFASFVLPLRAGEFVRPWAASRWQPVSFSRAFASVVTERVFDVLALLFFLGICLTKIENVPDFVTIGAKLLGLIAFAILFVMLGAYFQGERLWRFADWVFAILLKARAPKAYDQLSGMLKEFLEGLKAISNGRELFFVLFWSFVLWAEMALFYQVGIWLFGEWPSIWVGVLVNVMVALAVAAPSAPGFIGTFQLGCVAALSIVFGYSKEFAVAYSIICHSIQVLLTVVGGLVVLKLEGVGFQELSKKTVS